MPSISSLDTCAETHLTHYLFPGGPRAFGTYDRRGSPGVFEPVDAFAPGLLDAPVSGRYVIAMFKEKDETNTKYVELRRNIEDSLRSEVCQEGKFLVAPPDNNDAWQLVRKAFISSNNTPGIKAGIVSKMLHRKLPNLVPIYDSKLRDFYGLGSRDTAAYWNALHEDWSANSTRIGKWANGRQTSDGRPLSLLRAADIVIWEHMQGCGSAP